MSLPHEIALANALKNVREGSGRDAVRSYAEEQQRWLRMAALRGENVHQRALDLFDRWQAHVSAFAPDEQLRLATIYDQETRALSIVAEAQATHDATATQRAGTIIAIVIVILGMWWALF